MGRFFVALCNEGIYYSILVIKQEIHTHRQNNAKAFFWFTSSSVCCIAMLTWTEFWLLYQSGHEWLKISVRVIKGDSLMTGWSWLRSSAMTCLIFDHGGRLHTSSSGSACLKGRVLKWVQTTTIRFQGMKKLIASVIDWRRDDWFWCVNILYLPSACTISLWQWYLPKE